MGRGEETSIYENCILVQPQQKTILRVQTRYIWDSIVIDNPPRYVRGVKGRRKNTVQKNVG